MRRYIPLIVLCLLVAAAVVPGVAATAQSSHQDIHLTIETPRYVLDEQGLRVPGYALSAAPGAPQLPVWTTVVELPPGAEWAIEEVGSNEQLLRAPAALPTAPTTELRLDGPPSNYSQDEIAHALTVARRPDPEIYATDALYPGQYVQAGPEGLANGRRLLPLKVYPFQYNPVSGVLHYRPRVELTIHFEPRLAESERLTASSSVVAAKAPVPGVRIHTIERGIYHLTYAALSAAGVPVASLNPAELAIWYLGEPVDIEVSGAEDGQFDPDDEVRFYAEPYAGRYMTQNVYRLTWSGDPGARMETRSAAPTIAQPPVTTMQQRAHLEYDRVYYSTYGDLARDADHFFDNPLYPLTGSPTAAVTYTLRLEEVAPAGDAEVRVGVHGGLAVADRNPDQSLLLRLNGTELGPYTWDGSVTQVITQSVAAAALTSGPNTLTLVASLSQLPGLTLYWLSPDWAEILYPAEMVAKDNRLFAETTIETGAASGSDLQASGFTSGDIQVYDVGDPRHPLRLTGEEVTGSGGSNAVTFAGTANTSYYLLTDAGLRAPAAIEYDQASSLTAPANDADYIAIAHRSLWDAVQPLLDHRAAEGLRVAKVDVQDVYDEFSGGRVDPEAIRSFLAVAYHNWNEGGPRPQYVLLVGDGHFDFKGSLRPDLPNLIPPYLIDVDPFIGETAADNRYVSIDGDADFLPDMAIGRIPAKSPSDVTAVVDKILAYETGATPGAWQQRAVFVADNKNDAAGNFHALSDESRLALPASYSSQAIYYKSSAALDTAAEMKAAVKSALNEGAIYLQWFGHAARNFWGKDKIWELSDPAKLATNTAWPFTASYSCWAGYFINVQSSSQYGNSEQVLAEAMLLASKKSSIADFSPTGLHIGGDLVALNKALTDALFAQRVARVGLAVDAAKLAYFGQGGGALDLIDTQVLFGDPATRLKLSYAPVYLPLLRR